MSPIRVLCMNSKYSDRPLGLERAYDTVMRYLDDEPNIVLGQEFNGASRRKIHTALGDDIRMVWEPQVNGFANGTFAGWRFPEFKLHNPDLKGVDTVYSPPKDGPFERYHGEEKHDWRRFLSWAVLEDKDGNVFSIASGHGHLINNKAAELKQFTNIVNRLNWLKQFGPVIYGGDQNDPAKTGTVGEVMRANGFTLAGSLGNSIDSVWTYNMNIEKVKTVDRQKLEPALDHPIISVELSVKAPAGRRLKYRALTWNLLGASHTDPKNGEHYVKRWATWDKRLPLQVEAIKASRATVGGLQECQTAQGRALKKEFPDYGWAIGTVTNDNRIFWDKRVWKRVRPRLAVMVPYFKGKLKGMPLVLLQHLETGEQRWVLNVHNPANVNGPAQKYRDEAELIEAQYIKDLDPKAKFILVGDWNDSLKDVLDTLQKVYPGAHGVGAQVDHIIARKGSKLTRVQVARPFDGKASDHPLVAADITEVIA